jgi:hypothetical protein
MAGNKFVKASPSLMTTPPHGAHFVLGVRDPSGLGLRARVVHTRTYMRRRNPGWATSRGNQVCEGGGGCSAPAGRMMPPRLADMGRMKLRLWVISNAGNPACPVDDPPPELQRHADEPDHYRYFTPARFIRTIDATLTAGRYFISMRISRRVRSGDYVWVRPAREGPDEGRCDAAATQRLTTA